MALDLDDYVQRKIWYGCFEPAQVRVAARMIRAGDTVIDVGANVGFYTLLFARLVGPTGTVHAFEPIHGDALEANVALNGYRNVVVHRTAVGAVEGSLTMTNPRAGDSTGSWQRSGDQGRQVRQVALDRYAGKRVGFLKVDVEGMEAEVLAGLSDALAARRIEVLMVEMAGDLLDEPAPVTEPLREAGYTLRRIGEFGRLRRLGRPGYATRMVGLYYLLAFRPRGAQSQDAARTAAAVA
jgi:FkbM family methyltransferase